MLDRKTLMVPTTDSSFPDIYEVFSPFRPKGLSTLSMDYDIDFNRYRIVYEWSNIFLWVGLDRDDVLHMDPLGMTRILTYLYKNVWRQYKVPEREPHLILGEN